LANDANISVKKGQSPLNDLIQIFDKSGSIDPSFV